MSKNRINIFLGLSVRIFAVIFLARLIRDTGARMIFPFIPQISEGLGLSVVAFTFLISIQSLAGIMGPIFGVFSDKYGRRKIMVLGLLCQGVGAVGLALSQQGWAALPMFLMGLGMAIFIPAQQAYISDQVAYQKRGRALAAIEFSWALTAILILPVAGWSIDTFGWHTPFLVLAPFTLLAAAFIWFGLPRVEHLSQTKLSWSTIRAVFFRTNVMAAIVVALLIYTALSAFLSLWGIWLSSDFGLEATAIGFVSTAIGITELGGSISASLFIDRIGKKRGGAFGLILGTLIFLLLPLTRGQLYLAIAGLVGLGLMLEFTIVSLIPLYSEQVPQARGTVLSLMLFGSSIGLAVGPPITAKLWEQSGLWAICAVTAACLLLACFIMLRFLREEEPLA